MLCHCCGQKRGIISLEAARNAFTPHDKSAFFVSEADRFTEKEYKQTYFDLTLINSLLRGLQSIGPAEQTDIKSGEAESFT